MKEETSKDILIERLQAQIEIHKKSYSELLDKYTHELRKNEQSQIRITEVLSDNEKLIVENQNLRRLLNNAIPQKISEKTGIALTDYFDIDQFKKKITQSNSQDIKNMVLQSTEHIINYMKVFLDNDDKQHESNKNKRKLHPKQDSVNPNPDKVNVKVYTSIIDDPILISKNQKVVQKDLKFEIIGKSVNNEIEIVPNNINDSLSTVRNYLDMLDANNKFKWNNQIDKSLDTYFESLISPDDSNKNRKNYQSHIISVIEDDED